MEIYLVIILNILILSGLVFFILKRNSSENSDLKVEEKLKQVIQQISIDNSTKMREQNISEINNTLLPFKEQLQRELDILKKNIDEQNSDPELDNPHFYAREALGLFEVFDSVFSATNERERLYTVLGGQVGNSWQLQESTNEIAQQGRMDEVDLLTIAPYYSGVDRVLPAFNRGGLDAVFPALDSVVTDLYALIALFT